MKFVFLNGQPKSGNHILYSLSKYFNRPMLSHHFGTRINKNFGLHMLINFLDTKPEHIKVALKSDLIFIEPHFPWSSEREQLLRARKYKMILIVRDLRDTVAAYYRSLKFHNPTACHFQEKFDKEYSNSQEKFIEDVVLAKFGVGSDIDSSSPMHFKDYYFTGSSSPLHFKNYYFPWTKVDFCYVVKFENLIGNKGGGNDLVQKNELKQIAEFIGLPQTDEWYQKTALELYNPEANSYVSGGGIGIWKKYFSEKNIEIFEKTVGDLNRKLGYK